MADNFDQVYGPGGMIHDSYCKCKKCKGHTIQPRAAGESEQEDRPGGSAGGPGGHRPHCKCPVCRFPNMRPRAAGAHDCTVNTVQCPPNCESEQQDRPGGWWGGGQMGHRPNCHCSMCRLPNNWPRANGATEQYDEEGAHACSVNKTDYGRFHSPWCKCPMCRPKPKPKPK